MPLRNMSANHIAASGGDHEAQRQNNVLLYIIGLGSIPGVQGIPDDTLTLALSAAPLPKRNMGRVETSYLNETRKTAGKPQYSDITFVFNDYVDVPVRSVLEAWNTAVFDPETGKIGLASAYKKTGLLKLYGPNGEFDREYELVGIWPGDFDGGDGDMASEEGVKISVTFSYDKYIPRGGIKL